MFQKTLRQTRRQVGGSTVAMRMTAPLPYFLIIVKVVAWGRVYFSDTQNLKTVC